MVEQGTLPIPALLLTVYTTNKAKSRATLEDKKQAKRAGSKKRKELCKCGDVERREGALLPATDRKLAEMTKTPRNIHSDY